MEISFRDLMTVLHGMGFGALFMLAFSARLASRTEPTHPLPARCPMRAHRPCFGSTWQVWLR